MDYKQLCDPAPVVQNVIKAKNKINCYLLDKCWQGKLLHFRDNDLSSG